MSEIRIGSKVVYTRGSSNVVRIGTVWKLRPNGRASVDFDDTHDKEARRKRAHVLLSNLITVEDFSFRLAEAKGIKVS